MHVHLRIAFWLQAYCLDSLPRSFKFIKGSQNELTEYVFGRRKYGHLFCPICGSAPISSRLEEGEGGFDVNLRCVEGVVLAGLHTIAVDGASYLTQ